MTYIEFLEKTINNGIAAAKASYKEEYQKQKLAGSLAGFRECKGRSPQELGELLETCAISVKDAFTNNDEDNYWWYRCYQAEVEFVCNVVSSMLVNSGCKPIITPTCRGAVAAYKVVNNLL
jgi:hypothetical protein